ncbi:MAG: hypothetical protein LQ340_001585 [Diploschistes diacapsis]|nr:MAG: hypothetical protein LQ340_001585 [Diploschistes diacapsis]
MPTFALPQPTASTAYVTPNRTRSTTIRASKMLRQRAAGIGSSSGPLLPSITTPPGRSRGPACYRYSRKARERQKQGGSLNDAAQLPFRRVVLAAVVEDDGDMASFAYDQSMTLIDRALGDPQQVDSIAITPLTLSSCLLTGYLHPHLDAVRADLDRMAAAQASSFSSDSEIDSDVDLESGARMLRSKNLSTWVIPMIGNEFSSEVGDGLTDYDSELDHIGSYACEEDETDRLESTVNRQRRPWEF